MKIGPVDLSVRMPQEEVAAEAAEAAAEQHFFLIY